MDTPAAEPWKALPSTELKANTVVFQAHPGTSITRYVQFLQEQGYSDILSVQIITGGHCRLTVGNQKTAESIVSNGFHVGDGHVLPSFVNRPSIQLHVHDCPIWVSDAVVVSVLSSYGKVVGPVRHGKIKLENGSLVATGVRFATFELKAGLTSVPSYLRTTDGRYTIRVFHANQTPTCRICSSTTHMAKDCPDLARKKTSGARTDRDSDDQKSCLKEPASYAHAAARARTHTQEPAKLIQNATTTCTQTTDMDTATCTVGTPVHTSPPNTVPTVAPVHAHNVADQHFALHVTTEDDEAGSDESESESESDADVVTARNSIVTSDVEAPLTSHNIQTAASTPSDATRVIRLLSDLTEPPRQDDNEDAEWELPKLTRKRPPESQPDSTETSPEGPNSVPRKTGRKRRKKNQKSLTSNP